MAKTTIEIDGEQKTVPGLLSCRVAIACVGFFGGICLYLMRINMSVAIVCMTYDAVENSTVPDNDTQYGGMGSFFGDLFYQNEEENCPQDDVEKEDDTGEFDWDRQLRGTVTSSFFWGYVCTQLLGGFLAVHFGPKWVIFCGMVLQVGGTLLSAPAARLSPYALMVCRLVGGLGAGVYYPAFHHIWSVWAPPGERSRLLTFVLSGNSWGSVFSFAFSGLICANIGWPWVFYLYGIIGVVWMLLWVFTAFNRPEDHPRISQAEVKYIGEAIGVKNKEHIPVPWFKLLTSVPVITIVVADFCNAWSAYTSLTTLPQYMEDVLKVDIKQNGLYNSLPHVVKFCSTILFAILADFLIERKILNITWTRKLIQSLAFIPPAGFAIGISFLGCNDIALAITFLCLQEGFTGGTRSGLLTNIVDVAPRYSGIVMGIANTAANLPGIFAPIVVGAITKDGTREQWRIVFLMSAVFYLFGWILYMLFASGEVQDWAKTPEERALEKFGIEYIVTYEKTDGINEKGAQSIANDTGIKDVANGTGIQGFQNGEVISEKNIDVTREQDAEIYNKTDNIANDSANPGVTAQGIVNEAFDTNGSMSQHSIVTPF